MAATTSLARAPLLLLATVESVVFYSSVYAADFMLCRGMALCDYTSESLLPFGVIVAAVMLISLVAVGLYQQHQRMSFRETLIRLFVGGLCGSLVLAAIFYFASSLYLTSDFLAVAVVYSIAVVSVIRFLFLRNVDQSIFRRRTLVVGSEERIGYINELRRKADRRGFKIIGIVSTSVETNRRKEDMRLGAGESLLEMAGRLGADEVVIAMDDRRRKLPISELLDCRLHGIDIIDLIGFLERETGKVRADLVTPSWLIYSEGFRKTKLRLRIKRTMDLVLSTAGLIVGAPLMLLIACAIKVSDGWNSPVLYRQERVGLDGVPFSLLKFRSMVTDAEKDGQAVWATKNDARITKVGQFIRRTRLDELPQIFNVIRGQMSIVGPRPERPEFVEQLSESIAYYAERHTVKPGMTGWAQLNYPYGASEEDAVQKLHYDLYYAKNHTLLLDLMIILQTVEVVLWAKGAR